MWGFVYCVGVLHSVWEFGIMCGSYNVGALYIVWELCIMCGGFV